MWGWELKSTVFAATGFMLHEGYVLCGSASRPDPELLEKLNVDAAIRIFNTTAFAMEIMREIPNVIGGFEGHCIYIDGQIETNIGDFDV